MCTPIPKPVAHRNKHLLAMARGEPCLLQIDWVCRWDTETTVAAHSNLLRHGKGRGRRAQDFYVCAACHPCHAWLDQGKASRAIKEAAFMAAHLRQVLRWREIATDASRPERDREAALWALGMLDATPVGEAP